MNICEGKVCMITPDSGTSMMTVPSWAYDKISKTLPYKEGCDSKLVFGTLSFVINGIDYDLPSHHFMERYYNVFEQGDSVCMSTLVTLDIEQNG